MVFDFTTPKKLKITMKKALEDILKRKNYWESSNSINPGIILYRR
jgi:hypothetical protein